MCKTAETESPGSNIKSLPLTDFLISIAIALTCDKSVSFVNFVQTAVSVISLCSSKFKSSCVLTYTTGLIPFKTSCFKLIDCNVPLHPLVFVVPASESTTLKFSKLSNNIKSFALFINVFWYLN